MTEPLPDRRPDETWLDRTVWVQDVVMLRLIDTRPDGTVEMQAQTGERRVLTQDALADAYFAFGSDTTFKPAFRPVRAICFDEDEVIATPTGTLHVPGGDAVIADRDGTVRIVPRHRFNLMYQIVAHGSPIAPAGPFLPDA